MAAATTYGIVVYKSFRARMRAAGGGMPKQGDILRMAGDENVQYFSESAPMKMAFRNET